MNYLSYQYYHHIGESSYESYHHISESSYEYIYHIYESSYEHFFFFFGDNLCDVTSQMKIVLNVNNITFF